MKWTGEFAISSGIFSHWQVWLALRRALQCDRLGAQPVRPQITIRPDPDILVLRAPRSVPMRYNTRYRSFTTSRLSPDRREVAPHRQRRHVPAVLTSSVARAEHLLSALARAGDWCSSTSPSGSSSPTCSCTAASGTSCSTCWRCGCSDRRSSGIGARAGFCKYYFLCGIGAGLCDVTLNGIMGNWGTHTIGASGAIYGLLLAFGVLYPNADGAVQLPLPHQGQVHGDDLRRDRVSGRASTSTAASATSPTWAEWLSATPTCAGASCASIMGYFRREYNAWKIRRAKKRFQVYLRKHGSDRDTFVN